MDWLGACGCGQSQGSATVYEEIIAWVRIRRGLRRRIWQYVCLTRDMPPEKAERPRGGGAARRGGGGGGGGGGRGGGRGGGARGAGGRRGGGGGRRGAPDTIGRATARTACNCHSLTNCAVAG